LWRPLLRCQPPASDKAKEAAALEEVVLGELVEGAPKRVAQPAGGQLDRPVAAEQEALLGEAVDSCHRRQAAAPLR